jgi:hypothetical protein
VASLSPAIQGIEVATVLTECNASLWSRKSTAIFVVDLSLIQCRIDLEDDPCEQMTASRERGVRRCRARDKCTTQHENHRRLLPNCELQGRNKRERAADKNCCNRRQHYATPQRAGYMRNQSHCSASLNRRRGAPGLSHGHQ